MITNPSADINSAATRRDAPFPVNVIGPSRQKQPRRIPQQRRPANSRISYLKVLTTALLRQIEQLDNASDGSTEESLDLKSQVQGFEAELIRCALMVTGGRQRRAARLLGTKVTTLNTKIRRYHITLELDAKSEKHLPDPQILD